MSVYLIVFWLLVGFCGTVPFPPFPRPVPDPDPNPPGPYPWLVSKIIGGVAGIIGGWVFTQVFLPQDPIPLRSALFAAASAVGAYVAANIATDIYGQISNRR
jgi:hypothetical protein